MLTSLGRHALTRSAGLLLALTILLSFAAGVLAATPTPIAGGADFELVGTYDIDRLTRIGTTDLDDFMSTSTMPTQFQGKLEMPKYAVDLYRVRYPSVIPEQGNRPVMASGLVAIPRTGNRRMPLVSYQHGTVFDRSYVPSNPDASAETRIMLAEFAAQGYIVIGTDYFGRGLSDLPDSYLVRESSQQATVDMYLAAQRMLAGMGLGATHVFVSGWSQGGWVTMQYLRKLEELGMAPDAAAAASPPVDTFLTMNRWMNNPQPVDAIYLPGCVTLQLFSQENYLRQNGLAASAIRPEYLESARALYEGRIDFATFLKATPTRLAVLHPAQSSAKAAISAKAPIGKRSTVIRATGCATPHRSGVYIRWKRRGDADRDSTAARAHAEDRWRCARAVGRCRRHGRSSCGLPVRHHRPEDLVRRVVRTVPPRP